MFKPTEFPCTAWAVSHVLNARSMTLVKVLRPSEYPGYLPTDLGPLWENELFETALEASAEIHSRVDAFERLKVSSS